MDLSATLRTSFRALLHRNFRLYWITQLVSLVGIWMQNVAQGWLMHRLTGSAFLLGLLGFAQFFPVLLFSLFAGVVVDRVDRRRLISVTQSLALAQSLLLAILVSSGTIGPTLLVVLVFGLGTVAAFDLPGRQSFLFELVGRRDIGNAIALNSAAFNSARIIGPALAGGVVALFGEAPCFWLNAASFVPLLLVIGRLDLAPRSPSAETRPATLADGLRYAWNHRPIRGLLLLVALTTGFGFQYMVLLPIYARDILDAGAGVYGLLAAASGAGSLLAALVMTRPFGALTLKRNRVVGLAVGGSGLMVFAWSRTLSLSLAAGFAVGLGLILFLASTSTLLQTLVDDGFRGRVMSLYTFSFIGMAPLGALAAGSIAEGVGAPWATTVCATVLLVGAAVAGWRGLERRHSASAFP